MSFGKKPIKLQINSINTSEFLGGDRDNETPNQTDYFTDSGGNSAYILQSGRRAD
jgi:hypothetical protein